MQLVAACICLAALSSCDSGGGAGSGTPATYTLGSGGALCGKEKLETALAYKAIQDGDKAGVAGLVARGDADYLESGTAVHAFAEDGELSRVSVTSGTDLGKQCWIPTKMLGTRNNSN